MTRATRQFIDRFLSHVGVGLGYSENGSSAFTERQRKQLSEVCPGDTEVDQRPSQHLTGPNALGPILHLEPSCEPAAEPMVEHMPPTPPPEAPPQVLSRKPKITRASASQATSPLDLFLPENAEAD